MVTLAIISILTAISSRPDTLDLEKLLTNFDDTSETYGEIVERLAERRRRPLDLNTCTADDLLELSVVSAADAHAITRHRRTHGPYESVNDLRTVEGIDAATIDRLLPFVTFVGKPPRRTRPPLHAELIQRWTRRLELSDGFRRDSSGYIGGPSVLQTRLSVGLGRITARATLDKDAGEPMQLEARPAALGYDFIAGFVQFENIGWIRRLIVGDFSPRFAHGVLLSSPGSLRSRGPTGRGGATFLRPYASAAESGYFRGAGIDLGRGERFGVTAFVSRRRVDAAVDTSSGLGNATITRRTTGLHRTTTERAGRGLLQESSVGAAVRASSGPLSAAAALLLSDEMFLDEIVSRGSRAGSLTSDSLVMRRESDGPPFTRRLVGYSFSVGAVLGGIHVDAELSPAAGLSASMEIRSDRRGHVGLAIRRGLEGSYLPFSSMAGGSDGHTDATTEVLLHGRRRLTAATTLSFSFEHVLRRAPEQRAPFATTVSYADILVTHNFSPWLNVTTRVTSHRSAVGHVCARDAVRCLAATSRRSLRLQLDYRHSHRLACRIRGELVRAAAPLPAPEPAGTFRGLLLYEELRIRPVEALQITGRLAVFSAGNHSSRIYTYESDLTYAFASPSFSGRGRRAYLLVKWSPSNAITLETKWSQTVQDNAATMGSGRDEIRGGRLREIRMQVRIRLR